MQSIDIRFFGQNQLFLELCSHYLARFSFLTIKSITPIDMLLKRQTQLGGHVVFIELPKDDFKFYSYALKARKVFPGALLYIIGDPNCLKGTSKKHHMHKLYDGFLDMNDGKGALDRMMEEIRNKYQIISNDLAYVRFTDREKDIISMIYNEMETGEIASVLNISVRTVQTHKANINAKMGCSHPGRLFRYAVNYGLV